MQRLISPLTDIRLTILMVLFYSLFVSNIFPQIEPIPFYPDGIYNKSIPAPSDIIGFEIGMQPVRHVQVYSYFKLLSEKSNRVMLIESGQTYEERKLFYLIISSPENISRLDEIKNNLAKLSDVRKLSSDSEAQKIIETTPGSAMMMYSIHGDELSGTDASVQLAYQLAAGVDSATEKLLKELIIGIYPMENPDGRERYLAQMEQWKSHFPNSDVQSIQHTGVWPWGRTNHYLFDLNRDWFILAHPESRERVKAVLEWKPQLVVDAHEMGSLDTYLFNPPREPFNPNLSPLIKQWWGVFASAQAKAFDRYGWSYYTREWLDEWYPGYGSSWPGFTGALSILYEQASTDGSIVKRQDGTTLSFREAVHKQFVSSLANLSTATENRKAMLNSYYQINKNAIAPQSGKDIMAYLIDPRKNLSRVEKLIEKLLMQGIEVHRAENNFTLKNINSYWDSNPVQKNFPKGSFIIRLDQPMRHLINAILEFDPRMTNSFLKWERESLEKGEGTRMYEVGSWSMLMAYGLDAYTTKDLPKVEMNLVTGLSNHTGSLINSDAAFGFLIEYGKDKAVDALIKLFEAGYKVRSAQKPFKIEGRSYERGTLLIRRNENPQHLPSSLIKIAQETGVQIVGVKTALSQDGPDLGGNEFRLLAEPRTAILTGPAISSGSFGSLWYLLDNELKMKYSIINHDYFSGVDLRKYNVLILPSLSSGERIFGKDGVKKLKDWISNGGTLIAIGGAAAYLADTSTGLSAVRLKRQALKDLQSYEKAFELAQAVGKYPLDSLIIWEGKEPPNQEKTEKVVKELSKAELAEMQQLDEFQRRFMPRGSIFAINLNEEHWLNFGVGGKVPAIFYTANAFLAKRPVEITGRISSADKLRLSGLVWHEAKQRWENTVYAAREAVGKGQIILFADEVNFRSYFYGTGRMVINAVLLGPGFGTQQVVEW